MRYAIAILAILTIGIAAWAAPQAPSEPDAAAPEMAEAEAFVYIDGIVQNLIPRPTVIDGQLYVPMRPVAEALGIVGRWLPDKGTVQLDYGQRTLTLRRSQLVVTAQATLVPLRRLTDLVGAELKWDAKKRVALVTRKARLAAEPTAPTTAGATKPEQPGARPAPETGPAQPAAGPTPAPQTRPQPARKPAPATRPTQPQGKPVPDQGGPKTDSARSGATPKATGQQLRVLTDTIAADPGGHRDVAASPDGTNLAMSVRHGNGQAVWFDGRVGPRYDRIRALAVAPGGRHYAYIAQKGERSVVVRDGCESPAYDEALAWSLNYSPGGRRLTYLAHRNLRFFAVIDGHEGRGYDVLVSEKVQFSPNGWRCAYAARRDGMWYMVIDGHESPAYDGLGLPVFSPDSEHVAYRARRGDVVFAVVDGQECDPYLDLHSVSFSPDTQRLAYAARVGDKWTLVRNGTRSGQYQYIAPDSLSYSSDGLHCAFAAKISGRWHPVADDEVGPAYDAVEQTAINSEGRLAYVARKGGRAVAVIGGARSREYADIAGLRYSPDGSRHAYRASLSIPPEQPTQQMVIDGEAGPVCEWVRPAVFSPDGRHVAYLARVNGRTQLIVDGEKRLTFTWVPPTDPAFDDEGNLFYVGARFCEIQRVMVAQ